MLAELRKWGGACCLATQSFAYLHEMNPALLPTVLANVKQKIIFRMSAKDANIIHEELDVEQEDIVHLDPHTCYVSLPYADRQQPTFSLYLQVPPGGNAHVADEIRVRSRQLYTRPTQEIDQALQTAVTRTIQAKSLQGQAPSIATSPVEEKKRVRTRKGKGTNSQDTHGSLHALELLAVRPPKQEEEEQVTPEEPIEQENADEN